MKLMSSNVSLLIAITVDTSEMRFLEEKRPENCCVCLSACLPARMPVCLSVLLMNKTSTNSLIFYFDMAKQKNVCSGYIEKNIGTIY